MNSGKEIAQQNVLAFKAWTAARSDADFRSIVSDGVLSWRQIARDCAFHQSVFSQNPRVRYLLNKLEKELRNRGVLPEPRNQERALCVEVSASDEAATPQLPDAGRLPRLKTENAKVR